MIDMDKLRDRLRALRAKTTAAGCTEEEALAAAEKLAELLTKYGLSHADLAEPEEWDQDDIGLGARRRPRDELWGMVAYYCDCKSWFLRTADGRWRMVYFGRPANVAVAVYLHEVLERAIVSALAAYKLAPDYRRRRKPSTRRAALKAFEVGMIHRLGQRLGDLKWFRYDGGDPQQTAALVSAYEAPLEEAIAARGTAFEALPAISTKTRRDASHDALAGLRAGNAVTLNAGVAGGPALAGLLSGA